MDSQRAIVEGEGIVKRLDGLLGDGDNALTTENFPRLRPLVDALIPAAIAIGVDTGDLQADYNLELIQSGGNPSSGRLGYIKGHLENLRDKVKAYKPIN